MVRYATMNDLDEIMDMLILCKMEMHKRKLNMWDANYPTRQTIIDDIKSNNSIVCIHENKIVSFLVYYPMKTDKYEKYYINHDNFCLIQRVMVHPDYRRMGFAQQILNFVETLGFKSIRLLTRNTNTYSVNLYTKLGYNVVKEEIKDTVVMQSCEKILKK